MFVLSVSPLVTTVYYGKTTQTGSRRRLGCRSGGSNECKTRSYLRNRLKIVLRPSVNRAPDPLTWTDLGANWVAQCNVHATRPLIKLCCICCTHYVLLNVHNVAEIVCIGLCHVKYSLIHISEYFTCNVLING